MQNVDATVCVCWPSSKEWVRYTPRTRRTTHTFSILECPWKVRHEVCFRFLIHWAKIEWTPTMSKTTHLHLAFYVYWRKKALLNDTFSNTYKLFIWRKSKREIFYLYQTSHNFDSNYMLYIRSMYDNFPFVVINIILDLFRIIFNCVYTVLHLWLP